MIKICSFLMLLIFIVVEINAQNSFNENFSSAANWTQLGTDVAINNGRVEYTNLAFDGQQRRIYYNLNDTLDSTINFTAELEFLPTAVGRQGGNLYTGHNLFSFTAGTKEPYNDCPNIACTGYPLGTQDGVMLNYGAYNPSTNNLFFWLKVKDSSLEYGSSVRIFTNTMNSTFYLRLERLDCRSFRLSVFSDANRTNHISGSPFTETFPSAPTDFHTVQIGNVARGDQRRGLNGFIDNLSVRWQPQVNPILLGNDTSICEGDSILLNASHFNSTYMWQDGTSDSCITVTQAGQYWVQVSNACVSYSDTINVNANPPINLDLGNDTSICSGDSLLLNVSGANRTYLWNNGTTNPTILIKQTGLYWVEITENNCSKRDSIYVNVYNAFSIDLGNDTNICDADSIVLDVSGPNRTYLWNDGSTAATLIARQNGIYWVEVTENNCLVRDSINVSFLNTISVEIGNDTVLCAGDSILLNANGVNRTYFWSDGSLNPTLKVKQSGLYWVEVTENNCSLRDSINVTFIPTPHIELGNDTTICIGDSIVLDVEGTNRSYLWNDGSTSPLLIAKSIGQYHVWVSENNCSSRDTINVNHIAPLMLNLSNTMTLCPGEFTTLDVTNPNASYQWQDGSNTSSIQINRSGLYSVTVSNSCETKIDSITINEEACNCFVYMPNMFSPNNDGINDIFIPKFDCEFLRYELIVFNRWGEEIFKTIHPNEAWDGTLNGEKASIGTYVYLLKYKSTNGPNKTLAGSITIIN